MSGLDSQDIQAAFSDKWELLKVSEAGIARETDASMPSLQEVEPAKTLETPQGLVPINPAVHC